MELIFNQQYIDSTMADMNYDAKKMPLGKLSKPTITRGYQALKDLSALLDDDVLDHEGIEELSNRYYSYIPHAFGRHSECYLSPSSTSWPRSTRNFGRCFANLILQHHR